MVQFKVTAPCGNGKSGIDSKQEAEEALNTHEALCDECSKGDAEIIQETASDGGETKTAGPVDNAEVVKQQAREAEEVTSTTEDLPDQKPSVEEDPVDWLPGHFIDDIQGVPTVNRKGYAVIASQYDVEVTAEPVTRASETDFEYAEFRAIAETQDGRRYSGFGSAHVDRQDGDNEHLLNELAETRAMKRATAWATGVGMTAIEELQGEL